MIYGSDLNRKAWPFLFLLFNENNIPYCSFFSNICTNNELYFLCNHCNHLYIDIVQNANIICISNHIVYLDNIASIISGHSSFFIMHVPCNFFMTSFYHLEAILRTYSDHHSIIEIFFEYPAYPPVYPGFLLGYDFVPFSFTIHDDNKILSFTKLNIY